MDKSDVCFKNGTAFDLVVNRFERETKACKTKKASEKKGAVIASLKI